MGFRVELLTRRERRSLTVMAAALVTVLAAATIYFWPLGAGTSGAPRVVAHSAAAARSVFPGQLVPVGATGAINPDGPPVYWRAQPVSAPPGHASAHS